MFVYAHISVTCVCIYVYIYVDCTFETSAMRGTAMNVCVFMCTYDYYTCVCMYVYMCVCVCRLYLGDELLHMCVYVTITHVYVCTYIYIYIYIYIRVCVYVGCTLETSAMRGTAMNVTTVSCHCRTNMSASTPIDCVFVYVCMCA